MMKKLLFISILLLTLVLPTSLVFADFTPLGAQCTPDSTTVNQTCPFCSSGASGVRLKWQLTGNYSQPRCTLFCDRADVDEECKHSIFEGKDTNGVATSSVLYNPQSFKPIDDTFVLQPEVGDIYEMTCVETDTAKPTPRLVQHSPKMKVTSNCAEGCEVPFGDIFKKLEEKKVVPVIITENDFEGWSNYQAIDAYQLNGSGEKNDLIAAISQMQTSCGSSCLFDAVGAQRDETVEKLESTVGDSKPVILSLVPHNIFSGAGHAIIGLKIIKEENWSEVLDNGAPTSGKKYEIEILDPNGPGVKTLNCMTYDDVHWVDPKPPYTTHVDIDGQKLGLTCEYPAYKEWPTINILPASIKLTNDLVALRGRYCEKSKSNFCIRDVASYLESNYPQINNPVVSGGGCCAGWSSFVLHVGYLGDFVGKDFHPNDGNIVGNGCDANHYPTSKHAQAAPTSWLANLWSVFNLFKI